MDLFINMRRNTDINEFIAIMYFLILHFFIINKHQYTLAIYIGLSI